ncbi:carbohydrate sulfotransferase 11-like [Anopheles maculipalpis]|uniref:carbohydrate sulfotransferase 11-like n=1 Tax=Anopheles maculipalpis TaxID=1496333 RepID=UPI0021594E66|nr:carbohydrate sulfotransferase 11-like [Anopheles maculipalpis]
MVTLNRSFFMRSQLKRTIIAIIVVGILIWFGLVLFIDETVTKTVEEINRDRLLHLRETCERTNNGGKYTIETSFYIHVKNESLLYCLVFKSGTTTWFYNINRWAGFSEEKILDDKTDNFMLARQKYLWENPQVLLTSMKNTYSFIVVRDPFERLISAYEERLLGQLHPYFKNLSHHIYKLYHNDSNQYGIPSFQDFARFVVDQNRNSQPSDLHWRPINDLCTPCLARYDSIIKMETFGPDLAYLTNRTHLEGKIKPVHMNHARRDPIDRLIQKYFSQLTKQQFEDLYDLYRIDFELFQYSPAKYVKYIKQP